MSKLLDRRRFLTDLAIGAAGLCSLSGVSIAKERGKLKAKGPKKQIVILGAGLAGLSAAYELQGAGHEITILEAKSGVGGRCHTIRGVFTDGQYAEAGALSFPQSHTFTYGYATDFKLPLRLAELAGFNQIGDLNGRVFNIPSGTIPLNLTSAERQAGVYGIIPLYLNSYINEVGNPRQPGWPPADLAPIDQFSCLDFLTNLGASAGAIDIIQASELGILGFGLSSISALDAVLTEAIAPVAPYYEIIGGNDLLASAFRSRLTGTLKKKSVVTNISQTDTQVTITYSNAQGVQTIQADQCVCAIPFAVLKNIPADPPFSAAKQAAINGLDLTPVARTYLQFPSRSWQTDGYDGYGITNLAIQDTYSPTLTQGGQAGILTSYTGGQNALNMAAMPASDRYSLVLNQMNNLFAGLGDVVKTYSQIWQEDPFEGGAFTYFQPGQLTTLLPAAQQPEGLIHFAGEHTSAWHGWMNGALESGNRAAAEVNQALSQEAITVS
ncbi:MAG TPA: FAD-dependent oxidoreductase [Blastocatellia bacterium]